MILLVAGIIAFMMLNSYKNSLKYELVKKEAELEVIQSPVEDHPDQVPPHIVYYIQKALELDPNLEEKYATYLPDINSNSGHAFVHNYYKLYNELQKLDMVELNYLMHNGEPTFYNYDEAYERLTGVTNPNFRVPLQPFRESGSISLHRLIG